MYWIGLSCYLHVNRLCIKKQFNIIWRNGFYYLYEMKPTIRHLIAFLLGSIIFYQADAQVIFDKIDSTLKIGKVGYRVECRNKKFDENQITVRPIGFSSDAREANFMIRGRVAKAQIDDLNADGYPDLVIFIYSDSNAIFGTAYAFISQANKTFTGCMLPDAMLDGKVNSGYKGHDQFSLMENFLLQKFPIYKPGDENDKPTGGTRVLLYQLAKTDNGFKFDRIRAYDTK